MTHLLDMRVWTHQELPGHTAYVRGIYPTRIWRCARHDCVWAYEEAA